jgi:PhnB protein
MQMSAYLFFDGNCEEAFAFYRKVLGGEIPMTSRYGEMPGSEEQSAEVRNRVMHTRLVVDGNVLMGSDSHPSQPNEGVKGFSIALGFDDPAEGERIFTALAEGGKATMPMQETDWAARFGMLVDRYGIEWMVNCGSKV